MSSKQRVLVLSGPDDGGVSEAEVRELNHARRGTRFSWR
jgi:hypothetical protein